MQAAEGVHVDKQNRLHPVDKKSPATVEKLWNAYQAFMGEELLEFTTNTDNAKKEKDNAIEKVKSHSDSAEKLRKDCERAKKGPRIK